MKRIKTSSKNNNPIKNNIKCPNCRYLFNIHGVCENKNQSDTHLTQVQSISQTNQEKIIKKDYPKNKYISLQLDNIKEIEEENVNKKQINKFFSESKKQTLKLNTISENKLTQTKKDSILMIENISFDAIQNTIDIKTMHDQSVQVEQILYQMVNNLKEFKQYKEVGVQDELDQQNVTLIQEMQTLYKQQQYVLPQIYLKLNRGENAIKLLQYKNLQYKQAICSFVQYFKNRPLVCNELPSYLKAIISFF